MSKKHQIAISLLLWAIIPALLPRNYIDLLVFSGLYAIAGLGVGLLLGQCGIVNLAQSVFYAIGAYATANLSGKLGLPSICGFFVGAVCSGALAVLLGWAVLRLRGYFLALATLALTLISIVLFLQWDFLTGAALGLGGIPKLSMQGFVFDTPVKMYYLIWVSAFICMLAAHQLVTSRFGLMMRAMRDAPEAAESLAIHLPGVRIKVFAFGAVLGSLSGSLFAHYVGFISFQSFTLDKALTFLLVPVIGGARSIIGVAVGALFVVFAPEFLSRIGEFHQILFGLALVVVVIALPGGLVSLPAVLLDWLQSAKPIRGASA